MTGIEPVDVLIVGAGISGIGAGRHLAHGRPGTRFVILEAQDGFGGTWLSHRYPGIRSDTDLHTYGYAFKPWTGPPIATAAEIRGYMAEVIAQEGLGRHIRYRHRVLRAAWSSASARWTVEALRTDTGETVRFDAGFLFMCQGYYRHGEGHTPPWPGLDRFEGRLVHPQAWPDDLDWQGRDVLVVGSGATAATIVPAMAAQGCRVTMLQRSPTYFRVGRNALPIADELRELQVDEAWIHEIVRRRILLEVTRFQRRCRDEPEAVGRELVAAVQELLGPGYDVATHFTPRYRPWQQRMAFVPDGDLFRAIAEGRVTVVTDTIERFTPDGVLLASGRRLEAGLVVTATGFELSALGDVAFEVDGRPQAFGDTVTYRGMVFTGLPNLAWVFGYFRAGWTLRADLVCAFVCRLLGHMAAKGVRKVEVVPGPAERDLPRRPWIEPEDFNPGYLARGIDLLPRCLDHPHWRHAQDYWAEKDAFPAIDLDDPAFVYR